MISDFNNHIRQVSFLILVAALGILLFKELYTFFPGFLGALTLYIISRKWYFYLTTNKKWNKSLTALLFMTAFLLCIVAPIALSFQLLYSKTESFLKNPNEIYEGLKSASAQIKAVTGQDLLSNETISNVQKKAAGFIPMLLNSSATMIGNLLMILFLSFFMFINGIEMEKSVRKAIPLRPENINILAKETKMMVTANAIGIPLISIIQGIVALIGYWIFGVKGFVLLGFITGIFAFFSSCRNRINMDSAGNFSIFYR